MAIPYNGGRRVTPINDEGDILGGVDAPLYTLSTTAPNDQEVAYENNERVAITIFSNDVLAGTTGAVILTNNSGKDLYLSSVQYLSQLSPNNINDGVTRSSYILRTIPTFGATNPPVNESFINIRGKTLQTSSSGLFTVDVSTVTASAGDFFFGANQVVFDSTNQSITADPQELAITNIAFPEYVPAGGSIAVEVRTVIITGTGPTLSAVVNFGGFLV